MAKQPNGETARPQNSSTTTKTKSNGRMRQRRASAPLSEMFGYATDLRSMTQGRGVFSMEFHHYQQVGQRVTESLLAGAF